MKRQASKWLIFTLVAIAQFMVVLDSSITNVALPAIKHALNFSDNSLQWVVTAYALAFGGFLLLGGRAADQFGRRRMLLIGMAGFTLFSLLIGISHSATLLIALRALQGLSAAFMSPAALSIVLATFTDSKERNRALGLWTTVATGGAAAGLLVGGLLTQFVDWRWNFFINIPIGIAISFAIARFVPKHEKETNDKHLDLPGAALITTGLIALVYGLSQAPTWGWLSPGTLGILATALLLIVGFVFNETRSKHPLMPLSIFKIRNVAGGNLMIAPVYAGMMSVFFLVSLYLQSVLHFSALQTGLSFLPFPIILGFMSTRIPKLVGTYGFKPFLIAGPLIVALGVGILTQLPVDGSYFINVLPAILLIPLGLGLTVMPIMAAATSGVPAHESGLASGLVSTSQQMGGAIGLAILSGVAATVTSANIGLGAISALVAGYDRAFLVAVGFMIAASILAATVIVQRKKADQPEKASAAIPAFE